MSTRFALTAVITLLGGCASSSPSRGECVINAECPLGTHCAKGRCTSDCRGDFDCDAGQSCDTRVGQCLGGAAPRDLAVARDLGAPRDLTDEEPDLTAAPPDLAAGTRPYGDPCSDNKQCKSAICSRNPFIPADFECTGDCNAGCMIGDFCVGNLTCAQSDIGKQCLTAMNGMDCRGGACLGAQGVPQSNFCTRACNSAADCPGGYSCSNVNNQGRFCVNVDATPKCAKDADCWYGTICEVLRGRCLGDCRGDADCPLWHFCGSLGGRRVCAPNVSAGRGGIDALCASGNDCRSGLCLAGRCVGACSIISAKGQWCPGGWGCNPIPDGAGGFTLGCLAAGAGALGAACKDNASCATGLCVDQPGFCTRFCNSAPCPSNLPNCTAIGMKADNIAMSVCAK